MTVFLFLSLSLFCSLSTHLSCPLSFPHLHSAKPNESKDFLSKRKHSNHHKNQWDYRLSCVHCGFDTFWFSLSRVLSWISSLLKRTKKVGLFVLVNSIIKKSLFEQFLKTILKSEETGKFDFIPWHFRKIEEFFYLRLFDTLRMIHTRRQSCMYTQSKHQQ